VHAVVPAPPPSLALLMTEVPQILRFPLAATHAFNVNYLGGPVSRADGYAFPASGALEGLCPVLVLNAEYDDLRASGQAFTRALALASVDMRQGAGQDHAARLPQLAWQHRTGKCRP
jgi:acetyl esterase